MRRRESNSARQGLYYKTTLIRTLSCLLAIHVIIITSHENPILLYSSSSSSSSSSYHLFDLSLSLSLVSSHGPPSLHSLIRWGILGIFAMAMTTETNLLLELALLSGPISVAVLVGLLLGWAWKPKWAVDLVGGLQQPTGLPRLDSVKPHLPSFIASLIPDKVEPTEFPPRYGIPDLTFFFFFWLFW